jgi:hypothetical protein
MMMRSGSVGPVTRGGPMTTAPVRGPVQGWNGTRNNLAWGMRDHKSCRALRTSGIGAADRGECSETAEVAGPKQFGRVSYSIQTRPRPRFKLANSRALASQPRL